MDSSHIKQDELQKLFDSEDMSKIDEEGCKLEPDVHPLGTPIIRVIGRTIGAGSMKHVKRIVELTENISGCIILDLSECSYLSSIAIANLADTALARKKHNGHFMITGACETIQKVIAILGMQSIFEIYPNNDEAAQKAEELRQTGESE